MTNETVPFYMPLMPRSGAAWIGLAAAAAMVALWWAVVDLARSTHPVARRVDRAPAAARPQIPAGGAVSNGVSWILVKQISAHHVLVVEVETASPQQARAIARQLVEPLKGRYSEALIYFYRPGPPNHLAARRVQWTPKGGYVEMIFE